VNMLMGADGGEVAPAITLAPATANPRSPAPAPATATRR
jgi:hypothetical protein